jgi:hypothetical protein
MSEKNPMPPQSGALVFEGRKATQFWLRTLGLEEELKAVQALLAEKPDRKRAVVPIVAEYKVDDNFSFIYLIQLYADTLGVQDGMGIVFWASPEHEEEVRAKRNTHAEATIKKLGDRPFDEMVELDFKEEK